MPKIYLTVTTDLTFDQRMIRICTSLAGAGYSIVLVGRIQKFSIPLSTKPLLKNVGYDFASGEEGLKTVKIIEKIYNS